MEDHPELDFFPQPMRASRSRCLVEMFRHRTNGYTKKNLPYSYYLYYMHANKCVLNQFRKYAIK